MAAILASNSCYCRDVQFVNQGRTTDSLSFSRSVSNQKLDQHDCTLPKSQRLPKFHVKMQQTESPMKSGTNGRPTNGQPVKLGANGKPVNLGANGQPVKLGSKGQPITMVSTSDVVNNKQTAGIVNGSTKVVNGTSLVRRATTPPLVKSVKVRESTGFPPSEDLRVLPSDESFSWANENYNSVQRSIDVWSFVLSLRVRVLFDNAKWAYPGGFTEDKQVMNSLISLEALQPTGDMSPVRRSVQFFLDNLLNQSPDQQTTLAAIGEDLFSIATDQPFRFPSTFTFVIRAFSTLEGIGYSLDPDFSFVKIAAPYAQARSNTMSMPYRVQRIEEFVKQLEIGDIKLRVRVLEHFQFFFITYSFDILKCNQSERAAKKATILQMATMYTIIGGTLVNIGVTFSTQAGSQLIANGSFVGAGVFIALLIRSMQRVKKLDKFEKMI
ncbi:Protein kinase-like domain-containing protein [Artemisia annua]|uniref:Protein kinase-like domain-containing protein n=1 Tax=Artemisia annua TaxID=35608 RepID=A0A2U1N4T4_ARTAN|nr:Protein kinase-like domain-containing protein [Artemisia annua]